MSKKPLIFAAAILLAVLFLMANYLTLLYSGNYSEKTAEVMSYVLGKEPLPDEFSADEKSHLEDVKELISSSIRLFYAIIAILLCILVLLAESGSFSKNLKHSILFAAIFVISIAAASLFISQNFTFFFSQFHSLFFTEGSWLFPANSALITIFPESFFLNFFSKIIISSFLQADAILLLILMSTKIFAVLRHNAENLKIAEK